MITQCIFFPVLIFLPFSFERGVTETKLNVFISVFCEWHCPLRIRPALRVQITITQSGNYVRTYGRIMYSSRKSTQSKEKEIPKTSCISSRQSMYPYNLNWDSAVVELLDGDTFQSHAVYSSSLGLPHSPSLCHWKPLSLTWQASALHCCEVGTINVAIMKWNMFLP